MQRSVVWTILFQSRIAIVIRETERLSPSMGEKHERRDVSAKIGHVFNVLRSVWSRLEDEGRKTSVEVGKKKGGAHSKFEVPASYLRVQFRNSRHTRGGVTFTSYCEGKRSCSDLGTDPLNLPPRIKLLPLCSSS
jgi:hypothetical protein